jgi:hypothetical protein
MDSSNCSPGVRHRGIIEQGDNVHYSSLMRPLENWERGSEGEIMLCRVVAVLQCCGLVD